MTSKEFVDGLRQIADWYEQHPDFPLPHLCDAGMDIFRVNSADELAQAARTLGTVEKFTIGDALYGIRRTFGALRLQIIVDRAVVCTRRVVGIEEVPETVTPAHTREIVEWDCHSLLKAEAADAEAAP